MIVLKCVSDMYNSYECLDLHDPAQWDLKHVRSSAVREEYQSITNRITDALDFMRTIGADHSTSSNTLNTVDLFISHEALLLEYEQALTRYLPNGSDVYGGQTKPHAWYNTSAHFLWIGDRTRQVDGAHVEYCSGIENPIGIKVGPSTVPSELVEILDKVDPRKEPGKVTLITRYGVDKVSI
jgi:3-deoxy-7-phosphoheptulonate synthase